MSNWKKEREAHKKARGLGFSRKLKECSGCGHLICRCEDRQRRYEMRVKGASNES